MSELRGVSLFSGAGGFEIGFDRAGIRTVLQAENDPWCLEVLARHWPEVDRVDDVRSVGSDWGRLVDRNGRTESPRKPGGTPSQLISSTADFPVRTSVWPETGPVFGAIEAASSMSSLGLCETCGHDGSPLRMSLDFYLATFSRTSLCGLRMGSRALTDNYPRRFRLGDRVRLRDASTGRAKAGHGVWTVVGDDTDQTPVHDPEPAYMLTRSVPRRDSHHNVRYCYESALEPASA